jgi:hypothetical protein
VQALHITVELVPGSEPIRGSISGEAATRSFTGWMQLISALQAAIEEDRTHLSERGRVADTGARTPEDRHDASE